MGVIRRGVRFALTLAAVAALLLLGGVLVNGTVNAVTQKTTPQAMNPDLRLINQGRNVFRYDTFGDQAFWGARFSCTKRSRARKTAASEPASARRPPSPLA